MTIHPSLSLSLSLSLFVLLLFCRFSVWLSDSNEREEERKKRKQKKERKKKERGNSVARKPVVKTLSFGKVVTTPPICFPRERYAPSTSHSTRVRALFTDACHLAIQSKGIQFWLVAPSRLRAPTATRSNFMATGKGERANHSSRSSREGTEKQSSHVGTLAPLRSPFGKFLPLAASPQGLIQHPRRNLSRSSILHPAVRGHSDKRSGEAMVPTIKSSQDVSAYRNDDRKRFAGVHGEFGNYRLPRIAQDLSLVRRNSVCARSIRPASLLAFSRKTTDTDVRLFAVQSSKAVEELSKSHGSLAKKELQSETEFLANETEWN